MRQKGASPMDSLTLSRTIQPAPQLYNYSTIEPGNILP